MNSILVFVSIVAVFVSSACPNGTCIHEGVNCIQNCSTQFCLCNVQGTGSVMTTANGTVCYEDFQVFDNDYRCVPEPETFPSPSSSPSYLPAPTSCTCTAPGVECIQRCEPYLCLCGSSLVGAMLPTSPSTVCVDGYQVWESSPVCSASPAPSLSICSVDGFYCMGHCSMTYYQCSNGRPSPTMLVPYGTVCGITQNNTGELIYPYECPASNRTCSQPGFQCLSNCSNRALYCVNGEGYAYQTVPSGLLCYDNSLVLSSQPMCASNPTNAAASFSITILADNSSWSVLSDGDVAASVVDSVMTAGSNTAIYPSMVSVSGGQRILYQSQSSSISRQITIYAPPMWDPAVVMKILNETMGHSLLGDALLFRRYRLAVTTTTTTTMTSTPTLSPVSNPFYMTQNMSARVSEVDSVILGSILGGGLFVASVFLIFRRINSNHVENVEKATAP
jgi:hypothetical protein